MDTEVISFAEGTLAMQCLIPAEFPGLLTDVTSDKLWCKFSQHCHHTTTDKYQFITSVFSTVNRLVRGLKCLKCCKKCTKIEYII